MREYSGIISLTKNDRGIYTLDTSIGCSSGMAATVGGCYGDCYSAKFAKIYGYDFSKTVVRSFKSEKHKRDIVNAISKIKLPFIRIGSSGDPSEFWQHTLDVCKIISGCNKEIIIITRHWTHLTDKQLEFLKTMNICINTSVSAMDTEMQMNNSLLQYNRVKPFCKSILRVVSCDFNIDNPEGHRLYKIQQSLFKNESVLDTVFRPSKNNYWVTSGIINARYGSFLGKKTFLSKYNKKAYVGKCGNCLEMCGVNIPGDRNYIKPIPIISQLTLL